MTWSTQSKAFLKSMNNMPTLSPSSKASFQTSVRCNKRPSEEWPFLFPLSFRQETVRDQMIIKRSSGGLSNTPNYWNKVDSTLVFAILLWPRFRNEEGSCIVISRILTSGGLCKVGWKCCWFKSIRSNRHESFPLVVDLSCRKSICETRLRANRVETKRANRVES